MAKINHKASSQKSTDTRKAKTTARASKTRKASKTARTARTSAKRAITKRLVIRREEATDHRSVSLDGSAETKHLKKANEHLLNAWNAIYSDRHGGRKAS